jgi:carbamoyl-phosphate synthase large subunit
MAASPIGQVLLDQSVLGWGEFELEVMRDHNDNVVIVCSIENLDPMGVHTGDSVTVAPQQTLSDHLYQRLRDQAMTVIRPSGWRRAAPTSSSPSIPRRSGSSSSR